MELKKKLPDISDSDDEENIIQNGSQGSLREGEDQIAVQGRPQIPSSSSLSLRLEPLYRMLLSLSFLFSMKQSVPITIFSSLPITI